MNHFIYFISDNIISLLLNSEIIQLDNKKTWKAVKKHHNHSLISLAGKKYKAISGE